MKSIRRALAGLVLTIAAHTAASAQTAPPDRRSAPTPKHALAPAARAETAPAPDRTEPMPVHAPARVPFMPVATPDSAGHTMPVSPGGRLGSFVRYHYPAAVGADSLRAMLRRPDPAAAPRQP